MFEGVIVKVESLTGKKDEAKVTIRIPISEMVKALNLSKEDRVFVSKEVKESAFDSKELNNKLLLVVSLLSEIKEELDKLSGGQDEPII